MKDRFDRGASLWMIKFEGRLAGYGWTLRGRTIEPHYIPLGPDDVHLFDFYVFPRYRGRGMNPVLVAGILHGFAVEGGSRTFIEAAVWNRAQLSSLAKTPFRKLGIVSKLTILGRTLVYWGENNNSVEERRLDERIGPSQSSNFEDVVRPAAN